MAKVVGSSANTLEPLQVTDYSHQQYYKPHHNAFSEMEDGKPNRARTLFVYLEDRGVKDGQCGGATTFYRLKRNGLRVYPTKGSALMWDNLKSNGRVDRKMLQGGERVTCRGARKTGLNAWFLESPRRMTARKKRGSLYK